MHAWFDWAADAASDWMGSLAGFSTIGGVVLVWLAAGPINHYSDTWDRCLNSGATILTLLMMCLLQRSQNKGNWALQRKLDALVTADPQVDNSLAGLEQRSPD